MASFLKYLTVLKASPSELRTSSKMLSRILIIMCSTAAFLLQTDSAPALSKSRQYIEPIPGYIPVYIRPGDTPLEDINPDLAEAFDSYALKHGRFNFGRSKKIEDSDKKFDEVDLDDENTNVLPTKNTSNQKETVINLNDLSSFDIPVAISLPDSYVHIQKIPRKPTS